MSVYRLALKSIVENCIGQEAWIWVSGFRKGETEAKLEDFKMFDEASRGSYGALVLLSRMKASHLACIGSLTSILVQGFETFSSQMVTYTEIPTVLADQASLNTNPAPPPPRSETWHNITSNTFGETSLLLSTKAAVYDGIIATTSISDVPVFCETESCSWPIFPSLAVCGACTESLFSTSCDPQGGCSYAMPSGTTIRNQADAPFEYKFAAAPSNGSSTFPISSSKAIISIFDIMLSEKSSKDNQVRAYQCELWFCLKSYNLTVTDGVVNRSVTAEWSKSDFAPKSSAHDDEYVFLDIPPEMNANRHTRYSVPLAALDTLRTFMDKLTLGNAFQVADDMIYDTDWIEALEVAARLDLSDWISRLALGLTNNIQLTGMVRPGRNSDYSGTAYIMVPYVEVNWYLVAYPLSLMVLAFVYLIQTV
ncbi:hypothetical protein F5Y01DRAFT_312910 [Xylaria sp. FL0043]|nr:hypothetical protein F5Y01DRAFT_312910 [Xylaria sp. FL0043]